MAPELNWIVEFNQYEGKIKPDLAESWTVSSDGLTYTFNLVKNAKWQDGRPVTADDILYSLDRINGKLDLPSPAYQSTLAFVSSYSKVDDYTVKVVLKSISASFLPGLGVIGNMVYPKHVPISEFAANRPVGSGPYKFVSYQPDVEIDLSKNTAYWKKDELGDPLPYMDGIRIFIIADATAARSAYSTNQLDVSFPHAGLLAGATARLSKDVPGTQWFNNLPNEVIYFFNKAPWTDQRIRTAFNLALDRQAIEATLYQGEGESLLLYSIPGGAFALPKDEIAKLPGFRKPKDQDIAQANQLLDAFLKDNNLTRDTWRPKIVVRAATPWGEITLAAVDQLKKSLGLTIPISGVDNSTFVQTYTAGNFDMLVSGLAPAFDDPSQNLTANTYTNSFLNFGRFSDGSIDKALDEIEQTLDTKKRIELSRTLERKLYELAWDVLIVGDPRPVAVRPEVRNYGALISQDNQAMRFERTWLDKK